MTGNEQLSKSVNKASRMAAHPQRKRIPKTRKLICVHTSEAHGKAWESLIRSLVGHLWKECRIGCGGCNFDFRDYPVWIFI